MTDVGPFETYQYPGDGCGNSWHPEDIGIYLHRQSLWQKNFERLMYNEIILDGDQWTQKLPDAIDAFFHTGNQDVTDVHRSFLLEYGLTNAHVPLLNMDLTDWTNPFSAAR